MIWTFKQERNCCTISVCYSGCEMTPRRDSFARRQPPIQPVLDASFLLMQRSGTHALFVKLTGSHLPALTVLLRSLLYCAGQKKSSINQYFFIESGDFFRAAPKPERPVPPAALHHPPRATRPETPRGRSQTEHSPHRHIHAGPESLKTRIRICCPSLYIPPAFIFFILQHNFYKVNNHLFCGNYNRTRNLVA